MRTSGRADESLNLKARTVLVTGANTGVGRATAEELGSRGARVWLACRSEEKARPVAETIERRGGRAMVLKLDLADLASVRAAAERVLADPEPLHVLINNAGIAGPKGLTRDGFEVTFGTNHLGPFLFTLLLLPKLRAAAPARVVNLASNAHYATRRLDFDAASQPTRSRTAFPEYQASKLANILFTRELGRRLEGTGVHAYAVHPGVVASDLWRHLPAPLRLAFKLFMITSEEGAETSVYCATSPEVAGHTGRYYAKCRERTPSRVALDDGLARELWRRSLEWTKAPDFSAASPPLVGRAEARP